MKKLLFALIFILAFSTLFLNAEEVEITTSYPSPKGVYKDLDAQVYYDYDNHRYFLDPFPLSAAHTPYNGASLTVGGKVGIGTVNPQAMLDVDVGSLNPDGILIPRISYDDRNMMSNAATPVQNSLLVYQYDDQPGSPSGYYYYDETIPDWVAIATGGAGISYWDQGAACIYNTNTGNVGIGTSAPVPSSNKLYLKRGAAPEILKMDNVPLATGTGNKYMVIEDVPPSYRVGYAADEVEEVEKDEDSFVPVYCNGRLYADGGITYNETNFVIHNPKVIFIDSTAVPPLPNLLYDGLISELPVASSDGLFISARAVASAFRGKFLLAAYSGSTTEHYAYFSDSPTLTPNHQWVRASGTQLYKPYITSVTCSYDLNGP